ncbi:hypothetical protein L2E82_14795 [Cichorium intybus]|uniref:Uncharacterized protein n=1 Tax=Cichorium intybus TaxID=13427 RepID=A0ACB9F103_CICIN|nr:hypothetical protein L2E82_14795 [Cichorium intybus]
MFISKFKWKTRAFNLALRIFPHTNSLSLSLSCKFSVNDFLDGNCDFFSSKSENFKLLLRLHCHHLRAVRRPLCSQEPRK